MLANEIQARYGCYCFDNKVCKEMLSTGLYKGLRRVMEDGQELTLDIADGVAAAMKTWAINLGATHYTHWFQPMTGATAEKHNSFAMPDGNSGVIMDFNGKMLIKGEADASSFPSGGLRATFEARGYTTWDCTSPPFVRVDKQTKVGTLCIPTAFCSFTGEALDEKTPLMRSMQCIEKQSLRVLAHLGIQAKRVTPTVGGEQEYFLVDKELYKQRKDLVYTGRTLFGAPPAKGQELEDQYYASMSDRVSKFMASFNEELWKLGIPAQTQHYEAAPAQYELAPMFETCNIAVDHNALMMDVLLKVADRHGFAALLHEKPFKGMNGSGKHDNWSLSTDTGFNLLKPSKNEAENEVFLTFLTAVIAAVDTHADALRMSCATLGNSWRLGGNEAPPSTISVFTGQYIYDMLLRLEGGNADVLASKEQMTMGVSTLPVLFQDESDRNRTSPFAFTGNKFEFRMIGSSQSLGMPNTVLNAIVAEQLCYIADELDKAENTKHTWHRVLSDMVQKHKRVIFNGNNYTQQWRDESQKRGLPTLDSTVDAICVLSTDQLVQTFEGQSILQRAELEARQEIYLKSYSKHAGIEAKTMSKIARQRLIPATIRYSQTLASAANQIAQVGCDSSTHTELLAQICAVLTQFKQAVDALDVVLEAALGAKRDAKEQAESFERHVIGAMEEVRKYADELEKITDKKFWPLPSYGEMLFHIV